MRIIAIAILLASQSVMAATCWMDEETEQIRWFRPSSVTIGSKTYTPAPDDLLAQVYAVREYEDCDLKYRVWSWKPAAIRAMTQAERDKLDADEAQAAAEAALYEDPQPAVFVPRVSGTITNIVGESQVFVDDTGEVFAVDETGSPEHTLKQKQAQADSRKAIIATAQTAKGKGNKLSDIAERVAALEALNGIK